jgi:transcription antitermination factor NusG
VVLELTRTGENKVDDGTLESRIRKDLALDETYPIFIPAATYRKNGKIITTHLMEGYVFIAAGLAEVEYFQLEKKVYASKVMTSIGPSSIRVLSTIADQRIAEMRHQLREILSEGIEIGMHVEVQDGTYARLEGEVLGVEAESAFVFFNLRSLKIIAKIPRVFLLEVPNGGA